jgi:hypothetical protein
LADRAGVAIARGVDSVHGKSPRKHGFTVNEGVADLGVWKTSASAQKLRCPILLHTVSAHHNRKCNIVSATVLDATAKDLALQRPIRRRTIG